MAPGDSRSESVTITNRDSVPTTTVYRGGVGSMSRRVLGRFAPGESRTYRFTLTFPDRRAPFGASVDDNPYMGGSLSLGFHWRAS